MRTASLVVLLLIVITLLAGSGKARKSEKPIGSSVFMLLASMVPPVVGNLIVAAATTDMVAEVGYIIYCAGMDFMIAFLLKFAFDYCNLTWNSKTVISIAYSILTINAFQIVLNSVFHHGFDLERLVVNGDVYYEIVPFAGYIVHSAVVYGHALAALAIFLYKMHTSSRIYYERYAVIFISMILTTIWETYNILSRNPVDLSMVGFGISGILIFYFSLYYKPVHLLSRMLVSIASGLPEALFFFDESKSCIWANEQGLELLGIDDAHLDKAPGMLKTRFPDMHEPGNDWCVLQVKGDGEDKEYYQIESKIATETDHNDLIVGSFISVLDSTDSHRKLEEEQIMARHDRLTGLYNKDYLFKRIAEMLREYPDEKYLICFVDVNEFKMVNDVYGKEFGDHALREVGRSISENMTGKCLYGRLTGDTFGFLQPLNEFNPERINNKLDNFVVREGDKEHKLLVHVGVYEVDDPELDVSVMFDRAHMALGTIKRLYSHIAYYTDEIKENMLWNQKISSELTTAIAEGQIRPYLQPIVDSRGKVVGAEVLSRWLHPEKGLLPPFMFIPEFERNGKIVEVDKHMWRCACRMLSDKKLVDKDFFLSVNISPMDFYFVDIAEEIRSLVREYDIDPSRLKLEITEEVMMANLDERLGIINQLRADGHIVAMDDFGSGYSSLNMLKDTPADVIKVDMAFLRDVAKGNERAHTILRSVISMIDTLGLTSLTEGVETEEQFEDLAQMGCMLFQGYHFAKPLPVDEFEKFYKENIAAAS